MRNLLFFIAIIFLYSSCNQQERNERISAESIESILKKIELRSCKSFFTAHHDNYYFRPNVTMEWKNISGKSLTEKIWVEVTFIDNRTNKELGSDFNGISHPNETPFLSNTIKKIRFNVLEDILTFDEVYNNKNKVFNTDVSCHIYINGNYYKEIKIENKEHL